MAIRRKKYEFKPDRDRTSLLKLLHMTKDQRRTYLKWTLYSLVALLCLVVQDVIFSRYRIAGATTDLVPAVILLVALLERTESGGLFALLAAVIYHFSGSAPGAFSVALLTFLAVGAALFRQGFWNRSFGALLLCGSLALMLYELGVFGFGLFMGRTLWSRASVFAVTGLLSSLMMAILYPLLHAIGKIGGETWKE